jgi:hypothetical protein
MNGVDWIENSGAGPVVGFGEYGDEPLGSRKRG